MIQSEIIQPDTLPPVPEPRFGIVLTPPEPDTPRVVERDTSSDFSFIITALFILFFIIAVRFRHNNKYISVIWHNITGSRTRHNVFDDTVRESSFVILLNAMWCLCAGVVLYRLIAVSWPDAATSSFLPPPLSPGLTVTICTATAIVYTLFMTTAYFIVGNVFSGREETMLWIKGYSATQGIMGIVWFPLALLFICYPDATIPFLWCALVSFIALKMLFIWKGMRIFFSKSSSWVLFLYYLCSLEIVPLILAYISALLLLRLIA